MTISAAQVKELRQATGVGMMECKKALVENGGDMEKAILWLRERGMSRAAKKAGRAAAEGVVKFCQSDDGKEGVVLELNCETDFSGKNQDFLNFADEAAKIALENNISDIDGLKKAAMGGSTVEEALTALISKVGENMTLRRLERLAVTEGKVFGYSHMGGKIGTLVAIKTGETGEKVDELGSDLAMHVAASSPKYLDRTSVSTAELDQERELAAKKLREQGKPEAMIDKILTGQMNKFFAEICFVDQPFVKEPKLSVSKHVAQCGVKAEISGFVRFQLGEGVETKKEDFAQEVAAQLK